MRIPSVESPRRSRHDGSRTSAKRASPSTSPTFFANWRSTWKLHEVEPGRPNVIGKFSSRGGRMVVASRRIPTPSALRDDHRPVWRRDSRRTDCMAAARATQRVRWRPCLRRLANVVRQKEFREGDLDIYFCALMGEESGSHGASALLQRGFKRRFRHRGRADELPRRPHAQRRDRVQDHHARQERPQFHARAGRKRDQEDGGRGGLSARANTPTRSSGSTTRSSVPPRSMSASSAAARKLNIVPDYCEIEVDRRTVPGENHEEILRTFARTLVRGSGDDRRLRAAVHRSRRIRSSARLARRPRWRAVVL